MKYSIVRYNDRPTGDFNQWVFKYMEGAYVVRHGVAATQEEAYLKSQGLVQDEPVTISFPEDDDSWQRWRLPF